MDRLPRDVLALVLCQVPTAYGVCRRWDALLGSLQGDGHYYYAVVGHLRVGLAAGDWSGYRRLLRCEPYRHFGGYPSGLCPAHCLSQLDLCACWPAAIAYEPGDPLRHWLGVAGVRKGSVPGAAVLHPANAGLCELHDGLVSSALLVPPRGHASLDVAGDYVLQDEDAAPAQYDVPEPPELSDTAHASLEAALSLSEAPYDIMFDTNGHVADAAALYEAHDARRRCTAAKRDAARPERPDVATEAAADIDDTHELLKALMRDSYFDGEEEQEAALLRRAPHT
jgi:hypothetical protein